LVLDVLDCAELGLFHLLVFSRQSWTPVEMGHCWRRKPTNHKNGLGNNIAVHLLIYSKSSSSLSLLPSPSSVLSKPSIRPVPLIQPQCPLQKTSRRIDYLKKIGTLQGIDFLPVPNILKIRPTKVGSPEVHLVEYTLE